MTDLQVLLEFRRDTPEPDAETSRRIYGLVTGRDAVRIVPSESSLTLLVDAETYAPIEWTIVSDEGTRITSRFETYELLPATEANLSLLSLTAQDPSARVEPTLEIEGVGPER